jgi:hypothetical protein
MDLQSTARRATRVGAGAQRDLRQTGYESLVVSEFEPANYEMSRAGRRFALGYSSAPTGKANVTSLATTAAQWTIFNNETAGVGKSYVFEQIGMYLTSGTPGVGGLLWGSFFTAPASSGASDTGISFQSLSNGSLGTKCIVKSTVTITQPSAPVWFPLADNESPNVGAFPGSGNFRNKELRGSIILPPQTGLGLYVLGLAGSTPLWAPWAIWCEVESDLE